jgi:tRNA dimethylallyltransferase
MLAAPFTNALVLTGPTGSGKTELALELATRVDAEIVAMDSMTLYRGMDIGTAKPSREQRQQVPHHLVDVLEPCASASVAWWLQRAADCCRDIESRAKQVLFVGGTPLYLKALMCGLFEGPPASEELRRRLADEALAHGAGVLHARLMTVDPAGAARIHPNDERRLIRALEVHELTGRPISEWQTQWTTPPAAVATATPAILWLDLPRDVLYERINRRVEAMFAGGLVEEVRRLRQGAAPLSREASQALGYKEVIDLLEGRAGLAATILQVQTRTRNFAKRQITWFRHLPGCVPATIQLTQDLWQSRMNR